MSRTLVRFQHKTAPSIYEAVGQQLHHYRAQHIGEPLYLDGSGVTFLEADGVLALLNCARLWHRWTGMPCILTSLRLPIHQYLERMDVFSRYATWLSADTVLDRSDCFDRADHSRTLLEITPIASDEFLNALHVSEVMENAQRILTSWFAASPSSVHRLLTVLAALTENIIHSEDIGHVIIQRYAEGLAGSRVVLSIADLGIGIQASLQKNGAIARRQLQGGSAYILESLKQGVTSRSVVGGVGLFRVQSIITDWQGDMWIRSQLSSVHLSPEGASYRDNLVSFPGTHITITVRGE
ncbi:MAG TPA: ATP-binding protein [Ktedonobacteraceae bacterium]|nr:ATP-binding protein [Ktedonobacteraceae bacterium]